MFAQQNGKFFVHGVFSCLFLQLAWNFICEDADTLGCCELGSGLVEQQALPFSSPQAAVFLTLGLSVPICEIRSEDTFPGAICRAGE